METIEQEIADCARLSDEELWAAVPRLAKTEREDLARFLIHLDELARRDLHLRHAYSGLFKFLVALGFSEWEARARAVASAAGRKFPSVLTLLRSGQLNLTALVMIAPYLDSRNHQSLLGKACRRSTRELQTLLAGLDPQAPRRDIVRVVSTSPHPASAARGDPSASQTGPDARAWTGELFAALGAPRSSAPSTPAATRLRYAFDASEDFDGRLRRARELLRHKYPFGEMEHILLTALEALLDRIDPERRFQRRLARVRGRSAGQVEEPRGQPRPGSVAAGR